MNKEASIDESYRNLSDKRINKIVDFLKGLSYTEKELDKAILPYVAQWLYDNYVNMESTCLIISTVTNINRLQEKIENIYQGIISLPARSKLQEFLTKDEFKEIERVIEPRKNEGTLEGEIDENTNIKINFKTKQVLQEKITYKKDGEADSKFTPLIEAVPYELIVYDSPLLDQPRTFKIIWTSNVTSRHFVTAGESTGATVQEIEQYLINAGFSHNPKLLGGALSCMINTMISEGKATIKTDIDNPGFYYNPDNDKITPVKRPCTVPDKLELAKCAKVLDKLTDFFSENLSTLSTVLKWSMMAEFSYAMKQAGKWMPWMYLKGSAGSGKTTVAKVGLYLYSVPNTENNIGGSSFDTVARLGAKISRSCDPIVVNEPAAVFNRSSTNEMVKVCVESTTGRSKYKGSYFGGIPAFAPALFTANQYLPEDDALIRRLYVLSFSYSQRKTEYQKKQFESTFHINTPTISPLKDLRFLGQFAASEMVSEPSLLLDDWKVTADYIVSKFYEEIGVEVPEWLTSWAESESLDDLDDTQREDIRNFFVIEFYQARKKIVTYDSYGNRKELTLDMEEASTSMDFVDVNLKIVNERQLTWAIPHTSRNGTRYICLTRGLRKAIGSELDYCSDLKSMGELLGWPYKSVRFGKGNNVMKVLKVNFDDFMDFMYPNIDLEVK